MRAAGMFLFLASEREGRSVEIFDSSKVDHEFVREFQLAKSGWSGRAGEDSRSMEEARDILRQVVGQPSGPLNLGLAIHSRSARSICNTAYGGGKRRRTLIGKIATMRFPLPAYSGTPSQLPVGSQTTSNREHRMVRTFTIADRAADTAAEALKNAVNDIAAPVAQHIWLESQQDPFHKASSLTANQTEHRLAKFEVMMNAVAQISGTDKQSWADTLLSKTDADIAREAEEISSA